MESRVDGLGWEMAIIALKNSKGSKTGCIADAFVMMLYFISQLVGRLLSQDTGFTGLRFEAGQTHLKEVIMSNLNSVHNKGQQEAADGKPYERYHSHTEEFFTWSSDGLRKLYDENDAHRQGYENSSDDDD